MRTRLLPLAVLLLGVAGLRAFATAGFAEWDVYTPGGHVISHNDVWKDDHGDCLRSAGRSSAGDVEVYVSHLRRWRYYPDHVIGEAGDGFFLFRESTATVTFFNSKDRLARELVARGIGKPESTWLTGVDGWIEGWFPYAVWRPCKDLMPGKPTPFGMSEAQCREALAPERLDLYRRTTWGRVCEKQTRRSAQADAADPISDFCRELMNSGR